MKISKYFLPLLFSFALLIPFSSKVQSQEILNVSSSRYVPGEFLVEFTQNPTNSDITTLFGDTKLRSKKLSKQIYFIQSARYGLPLAGLQNIDQVLSSLKTNKIVKHIEPNYLTKSHATIDDAFYNKQWALENDGSRGTADADIDFNDAFIPLIEDQIRPRIAVIDSGINYNHPDLTDNILRQSGKVVGFDFFNNDDNPMDDSGHGTLVAGIIAGSKNNRGIIGTCPYCNLIPIKTQSSNGIGTTLTLWQGIDFARAKNAAIINISLGNTIYSELIKRKIDETIGLGAIFVSSAGNANSNIKNYPAAYPGVISVAASNNKDNKASYSNFGDWVDIVAPGGEQNSLSPAQDPCRRNPENGILSTITTGSSWSDFVECRITEPDHVEARYMAFYGTSLATPHVTGALGLLKNQFSSESNEQLLERIMGTTDKVGDLESKGLKGGRLNLNKAFNSEFNSNPNVKIVNYNIKDNGGSNLHLNNGNTYNLGININHSHGTSQGLKAKLTSPSNCIEILTNEMYLPPIQGFKENFEISMLFQVKVNDCENLGEVSLDFEILRGTQQIDYKCFLTDVNFIAEGSWPINLGGFSENTGTRVADLDKDGKEEIILNTTQGVYVYNEFSQVKIGWPAQTVRQTTNPTNLKDLLIFDFDNDSKENVIALENNAQGVKNHLHIWNENGKNVPGFPKEYASNYQVGEITALDFYGTGEMTLLVPYAVKGSKEISFDLITKTGTKTITETVGLTETIDDIINSGFSYGDINKDNALEAYFVFGIKQSGSIKGGFIRIVNEKAFNVLQNDRWTSISVSDFNNDGTEEFVLSNSQKINLANINYDTFNFTDWNNWPLVGDKLEKPVLTDFNDDRFLEIATISKPNASAFAKFQLYNNNKSVIGERDLPVDFEDGYIFHHDLNNDSFRNEFFVSSKKVNQYLVFNNVLDPIDETPRTVLESDAGYTPAPAFLKSENANKVKLVFPSTLGDVFVLNTNGIDDGRRSWRTVKADNLSSNRYPGNSIAEHNVDLELKNVDIENTTTNSKIKFTVDNLAQGIASHLKIFLKFSKDVNFKKSNYDPEICKVIDKKNIECNTGLLEQDLNSFSLEFDQFTEKFSGEIKVENAGRGIETSPGNNKFVITEEDIFDLDIALSDLVITNDATQNVLDFKITNKSIKNLGQITFKLKFIEDMTSATVLTNNANCALSSTSMKVFECSFAAFSLDEVKNIKVKVNKLKLNNDFKIVAKLNESMNGVGELDLSDNKLTGQMKSDYNIELKNLTTSTKNDKEIISFKVKNTGGSLIAKTKISLEFAKNPSYLDFAFTAPTGVRFGCSKVDNKNIACNLRNLDPNEEATIQIILIKKAALIDFTIEDKLTVGFEQFNVSDDKLEGEI